MRKERVCSCCHCQPNVTHTWAIYIKYISISMKSAEKNREEKKKILELMVYTTSATKWKVRTIRGTHMHKVCVALPFSHAKELMNDWKWCQKFVAFCLLNWCNEFLTVIRPSWNKENEEIRLMPCREHNANVLKLHRHVRLFFLFRQQQQQPFHMDLAFHWVFTKIKLNYES